MEQFSHEKGALEAELQQSGANLVVATPGRLEQTMMHLRSFDTRHLEALVLDEADRLLDMGFHASLTNIFSRVPKQRRTGLFSATQTREVSALARAGLRNPVLVDVKVEPHETKVSVGPFGVLGQYTRRTATIGPDLHEWTRWHVLNLFGSKRESHAERTLGREVQVGVVGIPPFFQW